MKKIIAFACWLVLLAASAGAVEYRIHDLGAFGVTDAKVEKINNNGQALISYYGSYCLWENGQTTEISGIRPVDLNNNGQVIGGVGRLQGNSYVYQFGYWQDGVVTFLGTTPYWIRSGNDRMQIIGTRPSIGSTLARGFVWENGIFTDFGTGIIPGDINNNGDVIGSTTSQRAWVWYNGTMIDFGDPGENYIAAIDINDKGQVLGEFGEKAFIWENGTTTTLPDFWRPLIPQAINNLGQAVGCSMVAMSQNRHHAVVWRDNSIIDLGTLDGYMSVACTINDSGWIGGYSVTRDGISHAVLWEPVPEPNSILALLSGLGGLGLVLRRRAA